MVDFSPTGHWKLNGNGVLGSLDISVIETRAGDRLDATYKSDSSEEHWAVDWDDDSGVTTLTRSLPEGVTQTYTGYAGGGSGRNAIIAGSFTQSDTPASDPRQQFGWVAWRQK
ncbi:hypothetical protein [Saccharopolyspora shandongensis]|uniref:hypothetical protein n=1 Tax=Saccharopolyspora shandongensis TaxID=418495 RepID=UPI0033C2B3AE